MVEAIAKLQSPDYAVKQLQENIVKPLNDLKNVPIVSGKLITFTAAIGDNTINHGMERALVGWSVVDKTANANLYRTSWDSKKLVINSSAIAAITMWVF